MPSIYSHLWFGGKAEEAATLYTSLLPNSRIDKVWRFPADIPSGPAGMVVTVDVRLNGSASRPSAAGRTFASDGRC
jgi:predicted 3-demethylubiquinone-9 3-methyltransferase (glyoxalase superfamily)